MNVMTPRCGKKMDITNEKQVKGSSSKKDTG